MTDQFILKEIWVTRGLGTFGSLEFKELRKIMKYLTKDIYLPHQDQKKEPLPLVQVSRCWKISFSFLVL